MASAHTVVVRLLRGVLALAFLASLAVVALYLFGRQGRPETGEETVEPTDDGGEFAVVSEGFEFALTRGDAVIFEIRGDEQRAATDGRIYLENVFISMERGDGNYQVRADQALYNPRNQNSRLEGEVELSGPTGLTIESDWLRLEGEGREVLARGGVQYRSPRQFQGRSNELHANLEDRSLRLAGGIRLRTLRDAKVPIRMETEVLEYSEESGLLDASGGVSFYSAADHLRADALSVAFDPESREVRMVDMVGAVQAEMGAGGVLEGEETPAAAPRGTSGLRMSGDRVHLDFDAASGAANGLVLTGTTRPAVLEQEQADGSHARLHVAALTGVFENGALVSGLLEGPLRVIQAEAGTTPRQASADSGTARFDRESGRLTHLDLAGDVSLSEAEIQATGDEAFIEFVTGRVEIVGDLARAIHAKGTLDMPRLVFDRSSGLVQAHQGVKAVLDRGGEAIGGLSVGGGKSVEPVYVEADEILLYRDPDSALFRGKVRAWQGPSTIFADELRGSSDPDRLAAVGRVRTTVTPPPAAPAPVPAKVAAAPEEGERPPPTFTGPMNITADEMSFVRSDNRVFYRGSVAAVRDWAALECEELSVLLDPETNEARQMVLRRAVRIDDGHNKRVLEGDRALYDPAGTEIELFGDPVRIDDGQGGMMEGGRHFFYDFETGGMKLTSRPVEAVP